MQSKSLRHRRTAIQLLAAATALLSLSACAETGVPAATSMTLGAAAFAPQGYIKFCERRPDQCGLPTPIAAEDKATLERVLNQQQWNNVFNLKPTAIGRQAQGEAAAIDLETPVMATILPAFGEETLLPATMPITLALPSLTALTLAEVQPTAPGAVERRAAIHLSPLVWSALNGVNQSINARIRPMSDEQAFGMSDYWTLPLTDGPRPVGNCKHYALEKRKALVDAGFSPDALSLAIVKTGWGETHAVLIVATNQGDYVLDNLTPWIKGWQDVRYTWIERQTPGQPLRWAALAADASTGYRAS